jgi:D-aspartate ligase
MIERKEYFYPLILGSGINAYGIIRSLIVDNWKIVIVDSKKDIAFYSRYVFEKHLIKTSSSLSDELLNIIKFNIHRKFVIFPTSDFYLKLLYDNFDLFSSLAIMTIPPKRVTEPLLAKTSLYKIAKELNIPHPETFVISANETWDNYFYKLNQSVVLKPVIPTNFKKALGKKAFYINSLAELEQLQNKIKVSSFKDHVFILQGYIPGAAETLYTITSLSIPNEGIVAFSTGHKIRQSPPDTGTIISGKVTLVEELMEISNYLVKQTSFYGLSNIEYKFDERDHMYKLIEINPRMGIWNYSATASGVNLASIAMDYFTGITMSSKVHFTKQEVIWVNILVDFYSAFFKANNSIKYSLLSWLNSISGDKKVFAIFNMSDMQPFIRHIIALIKS